MYTLKYHIMNKFNKLGLITVLSIISLQFCQAQTIGSYLISSAGSSIMSPDGAFYLAVGEPMNTELTDGDIMISQGFLQVTIQGAIVNNEDLLEEQITVFPNPTAQSLHFKLESDYRDYSYQLYDLNGTLLATRSQLPGNSLDITELAAGSYLLTLHKADRSSAAFKIIKQ